jgi:hypothetical protein
LFDLQPNLDFNLVKYFLLKHDINNLDESIVKWRTIAQNAILELRDLSNEKSNFISKILNDLNVIFSFKYKTLNNEF